MFRYLSYTDRCKFAIPCLWAIISLSATFAYILSPMIRGDDPRWISASFPGIITVISIFWAYDLYQLLTEYSFQEPDLKTIITKKRICQILLFISLCSSMFFIFISGLNIDFCAHESCGADICWNILIFLTSVAWLYTLNNIKAIYSVDFSL